jgi:ABC-type lipoprotein export system ATPase subunit
MPEPIIKGEHINVIYNLGKSNEYRALRDVSVEVYPQEFIILFGPSGCGKSTLLYCLFGVLPYTSGSLLIKGEDPYLFTPERLVRFQQETIGIIYQAFYLIPSLNVIDNIMLPQIFASVSPAEREKRGIELLTRFGVEKQAYKLPASLSGGQQQRVAVSRSLVNNPEILLADEPVGNLDSISTKAVMDTLQQINQEDKKTVILVTHDAKHLPYAHRVYYLRDGVVTREVVNPLKPQVKRLKKGGVIFTEVDKLSRAYPYASPDELRVKSIVNYLTQDLNFDQLDRLEQGIQLMIEGKMNTEMFFTALVTPFESGGVGITIGLAKTMMEKVRDVLDESRDITRYLREREREGGGEESVSHPSNEFVDRLRAHLLDAYPGQITPEQLSRIQRFLESRVSGELKRDEFQDKLRAAMEDGGVGLGSRAARELCFHLEKLLAQGIAS